MNVVAQTMGLRQTVEISIPRIYTTQRFIPHNPLFIESLIVYPGDIITFDMTANTGTPFIGLSTETFNDPAGKDVHVGNSSTITVDGTQPRYVFVFVRSSIDEPVATSFAGTITIERATPSTSFIPPPLGGSNIMHDFAHGGDKVFDEFGIDERLGITTDLGNIYFYGQLVREVRLYTNYEGGGWYVLRSSDTQSDLLIYIRMDTFDFGVSANVLNLNAVR